MPVYRQHLCQTQLMYPGGGSRLFYGRRLGLRLPVAARNVAAVLAPISRGGHFELFVEKLYEVRRIGETALYADLCNGFVGRDEQQAGVHEPLAHDPAVGRIVEVVLEHLLERRKAAVVEMRKFFQRDVGENIIVGRFFEILFLGVGTAQHGGAQTRLGMRDDVVDQFGQFQQFGRLVACKETVAQVLVGGVEKMLHRIPALSDHMVAAAALVAHVVYMHIGPVVDIQLRDDACELLWRVKKHDLLERLASVGSLFDVMGSSVEEENIPRGGLAAHVTRVDILVSAQYIS